MLGGRPWKIIDGHHRTDQDDEGFLFLPVKRLKS
jgi:hypothetical protein